MLKWGTPFFVTGGTPFLNTLILLCTPYIVHDCFAYCKTGIGNGPGFFLVAGPEFGFPGFGPGSGFDSGFRVPEKTRNFSQLTFKFWVPGRVPGRENFPGRVSGLKF